MRYSRPGKQIVVPQPSRPLCALPGPAFMLFCRAVKTGVIVFAHGSRVESANQAVRNVARELAATTGREHVVAAFLELGTPDMDAAAADLAALGIERIVVVPYFLTLGLHLERDLPRLVERVA